MQTVRKLDEDVYFLGVNDRRIELFENVYPVYDGVSYNSYLIKDEHTCLIDTVDESGVIRFKENLAAALGERNLDYIVVQHLEPDHSATLAEISALYPEAYIVCSKKAETMINNYFGGGMKIITVREGDSLPLGKHVLKFVEAPMVHWPEVIFSYDEYSKTLFSADAFGSFGAISGNLYADEINFKGNYTDEMRRYYCNIVGKYGVQVSNALKKAATLEIERICPLHGLIWRKELGYLLEKYSRWASYTPEENGVAIFYASVYGHTANAADILAADLADRGVKNIVVRDVSKTDCSYLLSDAFRFSHIAILSTTYNAGIFVAMENFLSDLAAHGLKNRTYAIAENGSWAPTAGKLIKEKLSALAGSEFIDEPLKIISAVNENTLSDINSLAEKIAESVVPTKDEKTSATIEKAAMFKLSYGLYLLTAKGAKDNGCIINTALQLTDNPKRISVAVNKANFTCDMIKKSGKFNVSAISESADFTLFERFGFQSGRDADKFEGFNKTGDSANGLKYLSGNCSAFISAEVVEERDYGSHVLFIGEVTEAKVLSEEKPMTYDYYLANVKPKKEEPKEKKGWVCKICGYVYEGENLPEDFVCPLCKHGADDFEKIG